MFPIVGVGASAGGLEAFRQMLGALPVDTGMGFVLVQHLSPTHASLLAEILARMTAMPVTEVRDEPQVEPNHVYVIPPDRKMCIVGGGLRLLPREEHGQQRPIDYFLHSLAEDQGSLGIGVILSGTATDGTLGLQEVKAAGGITFAQDDTAQQNSMPRSAIASGCVDFVLSPKEIANEIARIARHPLVARAPAPKQETPPPAVDEPDLAVVMQLLRDVTGVDFTHYKPNTFYRRITRRMVLRQMRTLKEYVRFLTSDSVEVQALYQDVLINVTSFFRNPEVFEALKAKVFPALFRDRSLQKPLRVWVPGCSTGEEAYSLAIAIAEFAEASGSHLPVQIFATDLNETVIAKARKGTYPKSIAQDVSPERLTRFFAEVDGHYRVAKTIREQCVFARHNMLTDPPFSQLDIIGCRNFLIYLESSTQKKIMPLLHYALKPNGFLVLGSSETAAAYRELFEVEDARHKIFRSKPGIRRLTLGAGAEARKLGPRANRPEDTVVVLEREAERILLAKYAPPSVVIDSELEIRQFRGDTGPYLAPAQGKASLNVLKMAREGLPGALRAAISKAKKDATSVRKVGLRVKSNGEFREMELEVIPLKGSPEEGAFLVLFEEVTRKKSRGKALKSGLARTAAEGEETAEGDRVSEELHATREYLQSVIEQQESANEDLQSASEELQSANEELQSLNEELETSKEEIQSANEELSTVNDELQNRNQELNQTTNDMVNLLGSVDTAILMLGPDLCIRRFTPTAEKILNLIPADLGRPIGHVKLTIDLPELETLLAEVLATVSVVEREVQDRNGCWYLLRIRPYRTLDNRVDGAVILLVGIDRLKSAHLALAAADRSKNEFLALLAHELRNPLAPLRNALNLIETPGAEKEAVLHARDIMHRQIHKMVRLIDDLLDVSRITRGKVLLHPEPVELAPLLERAVEGVQHAIAARGQELTLVFPPEPIYVEADPTRMEQVFGNLLHNASKFTLPGGHIELAAMRSSEASAPGEIVVRVRDDGIGIDPEVLPRVFDLFVQAQRSLDRSQGGLGIGLTLVKSLVELHGGTVEARSSGLGQGSELVVRLPLSSHTIHESERNDSADLLAAADRESAAGLGRRVLVVDDNVDTAESLVLLLRMRGHEVEVAFSGPMALEAVAGFAPEIVLLDIGLPGLDGYEVARRLRQQPGRAKVILVALTGYGQEEDRRLAREAGFDHYLTKPVDPAVIYELLALREQHRGVPSFLG
ncbi:MAG TPA: chemotaxis protein CheB [Thermoanaerobaculia bacterium]|nr:chemotaxis protein CheB [Thermoanaerobaculia bacterium]